MLENEQEQCLKRITEVEELAESIRHAPVTIKVPLKKINKEKQNFSSSSELKQKEHKEKLKASAGAVGIIGAGAIGMATLGEYVEQFLEKLFGSKLSRNAIILLIILVVVVVSLLFLFISWSISRMRTARRAAKETKKVRKEINEISILRSKFQSQITIIQEQRNIVKEFYGKVKNYECFEYLKIPKEQRSDLISLLNHTYALAASLNGK